MNLVVNYRRLWLKLAQTNLFDMGAKYGDVVSEMEAIGKMRAGNRCVSMKMRGQSNHLSPGPMA